jgi:hypothetical protein
VDVTVSPPHTRDQPPQGADAALGGVVILDPWRDAGRRLLAAELALALECVAISLKLYLKVRLDQ